MQVVCLLGSHLEFILSAKVYRVYFGWTGKNEQLQLSVSCVLYPLHLATRDLNS